ncbi:MAG: prephenate dehydratase [Verrucomicrobiota bacterium]|jgi:chorismate mutase/prephenate dehydratase
MNLPEIRKKIDALDEQILRLLNERADCVHLVGELKRADGLEIYAPEREEQVYRSLAERNQRIGGRLPESAVRAVYREVMSASLALEKDLGIAYLGPEATFTHQAARSKFGASVRYAPQGSISEVFDAVARGRADYGVVPVENSWEGAVNHTLDMFLESELKVCAQILLRIEHHLLAACARNEIRKVYSHPQAFGQCRRWLQSNLPRVEWVEVSSTTRAAELAAKEAGAAAVAGKIAGELYGLATLDHGIQDSPDNSTRFLVIGQKPSPATGSDKTSLMFSVAHEPGALYRALEPFYRLGINIGKIESRPSRRKAWEYCFFLDVDGHAEDAIVAQALDELGRHCTLVKILGTFPKPFFA